MVYLRPQDLRGNFDILYRPLFKTTSFKSLSYILKLRYTQIMTQ